jgi:multidrug resistance efflux pump
LRNRIQDSAIDGVGVALGWNWRHYTAAIGVVVLGAATWFVVHTVQYSRSHVITFGTVEGTVVVAGPKLGGRLGEVKVSLGDRVKKGDLLARLDSAEPEAKVREAEAALRSADAKVAQSQALLQLQGAQSLADIAGSEAAAASSESSVLQARKEAQRSPGAEKSRIEQAQAAVAAAKARLALVQAGPREQEVRGARAQLDTAKARLDRASAQVKRIEELSEKGYVSRQELENAHTNESIAQGDYQAAQERVNLLLAGSRPEDIEAARQELAAAEAALRLADATAFESSLKRLELQKREADRTQARARVAGSKATAFQVSLRQEELLAAQAEAERARANLAAVKAAFSDTEIRSPADGVVTSLPVNAGEVVTPGQPVAVITSSARVWIEARLPETEVWRVHAGQSVDVRLEAYPRRVFKGSVTLVQPTTTSKGTGAAPDTSAAAQYAPPEVPVIVAFEYPNASPLPGMSAQVAIETRRR